MSVVPATGFESLLAAVIDPGPVAGEARQFPRQADSDPAEDDVVPVPAFGGAQLPTPVLAPSIAGPLPEGGDGLPLSTQNLPATGRSPVMSDDAIGHSAPAGGAQTAHLQLSVGADVTTVTVPKNRVVDAPQPPPVGMQSLPLPADPAPQAPNPGSQSLSRENRATGNPGRLLTAMASVTSAAPPSAPDLRPEAVAVGRFQSLPVAGGAVPVVAVMPPASTDPGLEVVTDAEPSVKSTQQQLRTVSGSADRRAQTAAPAAVTLASGGADRPTPAVESSRVDGLVAGPVELVGGQSDAGRPSAEQPGTEAGVTIAPSSGSSSGVSSAVRADLPLLVASAAADTVSSADHASREQPPWMEKVFERVAVMAGSGLQRAELRLSPEHLGDLEIRVLAGDGQASVTISASEQTVKDALVGNLERLRTLLQEGGYRLVDVQVETGSRGDGSQRQRDGLLWNGSPRIPGDLHDSAGDSTPVAQLEPGSGRLLSVYA